MLSKKSYSQKKYSWDKEKRKELVKTEKYGPPPLK